jgi:hypothetical protein
MKKSKERIQDFNKDIIDSYAKITNTSSNPDVKDVACRYIAKLATDKRLWNNDNIWNLLDKQYLSAEEQGVLMTKDGSEMATWTGRGIAHLSGKKRTDRGSVFCRTFSKGELAFLDNILGIFEYEANLEERTAEGKVWEWK